MQLLKTMRFHLSAISALSQNMSFPRFSQHLTRQGLLAKLMIHGMICNNLVINIFRRTIICYSIIQTFIDKSLTTSLKTCKYWEFAPCTTSDLQQLHKNWKQRKNKNLVRQIAWEVIHFLQNYVCFLQSFKPFYNQQIPPSPLITQSRYFGQHYSVFVIEKTKGQWGIKLYSLSRVITHKGLKGSSTFSMASVLEYSRG